MSSFLTCSGKWLIPFDPALTEMDTFYLDKYKVVKVPMMYRSGKFASTFDKNFGCHVLKLPYRGNASMLVVLMGRIGDHLTLEDYLTTDLVDTWLRNMKTRYGSPVAQLSLSFPVGTPNFILCLSCPTVGSLMAGAAFVLFSTLSLSITLRGSLFTRPVLIKALPLVRHCDACAMLALLTELTFY
jgi:hypothetical protein